MEFKPGEEYDLTEEQKKGVMDRYLKKERMKREYLALQHNPQRFNYIEGVIVSDSSFFKFNIFLNILSLSWSWSLTF